MERREQQLSRLWDNRSWNAIYAPDEYVRLMSMKPLEMVGCGGGLVQIDLQEEEEEEEWSCLIKYRCNFLQIHTSRAKKDSKKRKQARDHNVMPARPSRGGVTIAIGTQSTRTSSTLPSNLPHLQHASVHKTLRTVCISRSHSILLFKSRSRRGSARLKQLPLHTGHSSSFLFILGTLQAAPSSYWARLEQLPRHTAEGCGPGNR